MDFNIGCLFYDGSPNTFLGTIRSCRLDLIALSYVIRVGRSPLGLKPFIAMSKALVEKGAPA